MYTKQVLRHFRKPHNTGKMTNPDGIGKVGNIICGDIMHLYIKVAQNIRKKEIITDIKFQTFGCVAAISTSSAITDLAKGKTVKEALNISKKTIIEHLGSLPPVKIHCSLLATDALLEAVYDYYKKKKRKIPPMLLKRHRQIEKEKSIIRNKYREWIDEEEKVLDKSA